jgi:hypothetical protein
VPNEIVIRLDMGELLKDLPKDGEIVEKPVVPKGYRCQDCWRDDGEHEDGCIHRRIEGHS